MSPNLFDTRHSTFDIPMPLVHLLGAGSPFPDAARTTTMLAFEAPTSVIAVDCGGDLVQRLCAAEIAHDRLDALIITHEHPDHVAGFPLLMERLMMAKRRRALPVYGIRPALEQADRCLDAFDTSGWEMPEIKWNIVKEEAGAAVLENNTWKVTASPVVHSVPNVALRVEHHETGRITAYSCDTEPCDAVVNLARGAGLLIHEATGDAAGHSSAEGAARIAAQAGVRQCLLVHLPPDLVDADLSEAREVFSWIELGEESGAYEFCESAG